ncbi:MAG: rubredoxin, partial [Sphaerochaetaceae bacterium]
DASDRGAKRILLWSRKVSVILQGLLDRFGKEGDALLEKTNVWVCSICGFVYVGEIPPAVCPVCKVPSFKILAVERR